MMKKKLLIFLLFISASSFSQENIEELENKADSLYKAKDYQASILVYDQILKLDPKNVYSLSGRGISYYYLEDYNKAKESFRLAVLYRDPDDKQSLANDYSNLSAIYSSLYDDKKAYEYALKAYSLDKNSENILFNVASLGHNVNQYEKSIEYLDKAEIELHNDFNSLYGKCYLQLGRYKESIEYYEKYFQNRDENDLFVPQINLLDEKKNLWSAYMYELMNYIQEGKTAYKHKEKVLSLTKELAKTEKRSSLEQTIMSILEHTKFEENPYTDLLIRQFEMLSDTEAMNQIIFYYRVDNFKKSKEILEKLAKKKNHEDWMTEDRIKIFRYLNELKEVLAKIPPQGDKVEDKELESVINFLKDFYSDKGVGYQDEFNIYELPIQESFAVFIKRKKDFSIPKLQYIFSKIISESVPNEKIKKQIMAEIKNLNKL